MYGKLGQRGRSGRGSVLADAVERAYQDSPEYKAKVAKINAERKAAYDNEMLTCIVCGKEHPRQKGVQFGGDESMCLPCAIVHSKPGTPAGDMYREEWERVRGLSENPPASESDRPIRRGDWQGSATTQRFIEECRSALPMAVSDNGNVTLESVFEGLTFQQMVLKRDQQLSEWQPNPAGR